MRKINLYTYLLNNKITLDNESLLSFIYYAYVPIDEKIKIYELLINKSQDPDFVNKVNIIKNVTKEFYNKFIKKDNNYLYHITYYKGNTFSVYTNFNKAFTAGKNEWRNYYRSDDYFYKIYKVQKNTLNIMNKGVVFNYENKPILLIGLDSILKEEYNIEIIKQVALPIIIDKNTILEEFDYINNKNNYIMYLKDNLFIVDDRIIENYNYANTQYLSKYLKNYYKEYFKYILKKVDI